ncbi:MAG: esterase [Chloroflexi bacterium]|nr:MAG: esterase [Chloroflexota bacterium]
MPYLFTTIGPKQAAELGMILPHEHVFVDLRTWDQPGYAEGQAEDVIALVAPEIRKARNAGITALVECTPVGVGRRVDILKAVSKATGFPLVVPTGVYREPWIPPWIHEASEAQLREWMQSELEGQVEETGVRAGFIKLSAGDDGITPTEAKVLRAAAQAAKPTNSVIGSHTIRGRVVRDQLDIIEKSGYSPSRFIWIHTQAEPDFALHLEMARRGAWLEYDSIGNPEEDSMFIDWIRKLLDAGFEKQLMLSHDRGWYDPAQPGGGKPQPYTYLAETFLPRLRATGVTEETIKRLVCENPFRAFARN